MNSCQFLSDEDFDWQDACIQRETNWHTWTNLENNTQSIVYKDGIFAPVDSVHLMEVYMSRR
jgi:F-box/WD-40 domain protein 9